MPQSSTLYIGMDIHKDSIAGCGSRIFVAIGMLDF